MNVQKLEKELWEAADLLRANSKLTATEYSMPVLGLIFLRHADNRYQAVLGKVLDRIPKRKGKPLREPCKDDFIGESAIFVPESARYDTLANLPKDASVGKKIDEAMDAIEKEYETLKGALPRGYTAFEPGLLAELIKIFNRAALRTATGDVFGRIYEYFLNKFAQTGAQEGGEFFTPPSLVRMIVNVIEPDHGKVLDPACGSAGMFVQTGHFVEDVLHEDVNAKVTFYGQEKSDTNSRLARMNMVVHGLDATNIRQGNTFYDEWEELIGECDYVMANPPFNVDGVDKKRIESQDDEHGRLPFGLPGTNARTGAISNANSLWIQYFYAYLNETGRAGFVMASSASDAGHKDKEIREKLVRTGHVDVMMSIGNKFFYTRSLPCTLWFFDKGKAEGLHDRVLMIDARNVYHVVSARSHIFTDEQLLNLSAITWLYRGEQQKFIGLVANYQDQVDEWLEEIPGRLADDSTQVMELAGLLNDFISGTVLDEHNTDQPDEKLISDEQWRDYGRQVRELLENDHASAWLEDALNSIRQAREAIKGADLDSHPGQARLQRQLQELKPKLQATVSQVENRHKQALALLETAEKQLRARQSHAFDSKAARAARRQLLAADSSRDEAPTTRDRVLEGLKQASYFISQVHWLHSRFPDAEFIDVPGLCKAATLEEIESNDWSLTPGRYVGVAPVEEDDEEDFIERMRAIHSELADLNDEANRLAEQIQGNLAGLFE